MASRTGRAKKGMAKHRSRTARKSKNPTSAEAIKAAEEVALAAFASGLKLAAAFGTVAAKTTSLALASLATGADKFSELVRKEGLQPSKPANRSSTRSGMHSPRRRNERKPVSL